MRHGFLFLVLLAAAVAVADDDAPGPTAASLLAQADEAFRGGEVEKAIPMYEGAAQAAVRGGAVETQVEALSQVARMHLIQGRAKEGRVFLEQAARLASEKAPLGWSRYVGVRGRFEWKADDKPTALKTFEAMYAYCLAHELWSRAVDAAHMVAIVGTHEQQLVWAKRGIEAAERGRLDEWLGPLWNNLGNTYHELGRNDEALDAFLKARGYHWQGRSELPKLIADWAVGMAYRRAGRRAEAVQWLRPVLAWAERRLAEKPEDPERSEWVGHAVKELGLVALAEGRIEQARRDLERAQPLLQAAGMADWDAVGWEELIQGLAKVRGPDGGPLPK